MALKNSRWQKDFRIPSETAAARDVLEQILRQLHAFQWGHKDVFAIHLALEEALVNAIRHGNASHPLKQVTIYAEVTEDLFTTRITDEGPGFDPENLPDPTDTDFLERPCGRGVKLMQNYMTTVAFNAVGNEVTLTKTKSSGATP